MCSSIDEWIHTHTYTHTHTHTQAEREKQRGRLVVSWMAGAERVSQGGKVEEVGDGRGELEGECWI